MTKKLALFPARVYVFYNKIYSLSSYEEYILYSKIESYESYHMTSVVTVKKKTRNSGKVFSLAYGEMV